MKPTTIARNERECERLLHCIKEIMKLDPQSEM
jgi:hypothetical protein